jgi:hypothetical protein
MKRAQCRTLRGSVASDILGSLWYIGFTAFTLWGIGWSFYRHGPGDGVVAILMPPYAWYRGVAAIWDQPKWKEDYGVRTEQLALVIENAVNNDPSYQIQSRDFIKELKSWLKSVPGAKRAELREASRNYGVAIGDYCQRYFTAMISGGDVSLVALDPGVQERVDRFKSISGFAKGWSRFVKDSAALKDLGPSGDTSDLREGGSSMSVADRAVVQNKLHTYLDAMAGKMERTIDDLFSP